MPTRSGGRFSGACVDSVQDLNEEGLPRRCICIAAALPVVILWINFVSGVGFQAIVSQVILALVITYFMVFACALDSRIHRPELLSHDASGFWHAGRHWGMAMDIVAMTYLFVIGVISWSVYLPMTLMPFRIRLIILSLPFAPRPGAMGWNYAPFMVLAVILLGIVVWFVSARKNYRPGQRSYDRTAARSPSSAL